MSELVTQFSFPAGTWWESVTVTPSTSPASPQSLTTGPQTDTGRVLCTVLISCLKLRNGLLSHCLPALLEGPVCHSGGRGLEEGARKEEAKTSGPHESGG